MQLDLYYQLLFTQSKKRKVAESNNSSVTERAGELIEQTKDELLREFKKKLEHYQLRDTIQNCIINNLDNRINLIRTENKHLKTLNQKLRELTIASEAAIQSNDIVDVRVKLLKSVVKGWRESTETLVAVNNSNDALRRQAEVEAITYRLRLDDI